MQRETIPLCYLKDDDVIAVGNAAYKVAKIKSALESLLKSIYKEFFVYLSSQKAYVLGLCNTDNSIPEFYLGDYCIYEYLKLGDSNWRKGKVKIYLSAFLHSKQADLAEQFKAICYYPHQDFNDDDVVSFKKDCFCKVRSIKKLFNSVAAYTDFEALITKQLALSLTEFSDSRLFQKGKECELLRIGSSEWEPLVIGLQFTIDAIEDDSANERDIFVNKSVSPLDEIRNILI